MSRGGFPRARSLLTNQADSFLQWRTALPIEFEVLKTERDKLKEGLREIEAELRKLEADVKALRQREIQHKREIEALNTLIDIKEVRDGKTEE